MVSVVPQDQSAFFPPSPRKHTWKKEENEDVNSRSNEERMEESIGVTDPGVRKITENKIGPTELMKSNWNHKKNE